MSAKPDMLTAENVQKVVLGVLDACNELMTEFVSKKRAARWDVINDGLYDAERLNAELSQRLRDAGLEPAKTRSPRKEDG